MSEKFNIALSKNDGAIAQEKRPLKKKKDSPIDLLPLLALYRYAKGPDYVLFVVGLISTIAFSILPLFLVIKIGDVIEAMTKYGADLETFYEKERDIAIIQFILGAVTVVAGWISVVAFIRLGSNVGLRWKSEYFKSVINRPIKWFDKHNPAEFGSSIDMDCNAIEHASGEKIMLLLSAVIFFIGSWILAAVISLQLTLMALVMVPIQIASAIGIERASIHSTVITQEKYKTAGGIAEESLEGVKTVASCNAQDILAKTYQKELEPLKGATTLMGTLHGFGWSVFFVVLFSFCGAIYYFGAKFYDDEVENWSNGEVFEPQYVIMIFFACAMSSFYLGASIPCLQYIQNGRVAASRVGSIIAKNNKFDGYRRADNVLKGEIEFKDVHFSYPSNKEIRILQGVSFKVNSGQSLAIVGETGSGKSTIVQLIEGFYYCDSGAVSIDGINIREYDLSSLRNYIGLVGQEPVLFNTSIKENIRMGRLSAFDQEIYDAAAEAEATTFIEHLENKYETYVGVKGSQISGGQKQRIAIARAMIKKPKILLLDEATSALDMHTERKIQLTLDKVMRGRTTIIVAQRLSTIKNAERIIVLDTGKIIEEGTHSSLTEANGAYARLQAIQKQVENESEKSRQNLKQIKQLHGDVGEEEKSAEDIDGGLMMKRILSLMKNYVGWLLIAIACAVITGLLFPMFGYLFADNIISMLRHRGDDMIDPIRENMYYLFVEAGIVFFTLTILSAALSRITALYTYDLRFQGLKSLLYYDQKFFDRPTSNPATLSYRLSSDCEKISQIGGPVLGLQGLVIAALAGGIVIATQEDITLSLVVLALVPFIIVSNAKGEILQFEGLSTNDLKNTSAIASDSLTNIKTVHSFNRQGYFHQRYVTATETENMAVGKKAHGNGIMFGLRYMVLYYVWGILAWYGAYRVKEGQMDIESMLIVFFCIMFSSWGFMVVGALVPDVEGGIESAKHMFAVIDYKPEINANSDSGILTPINGSVAFDNVIFQYEGRSNIVLHNVSFKLEAGKTLGITGTTGSGKSTIAQLIMRFYDPSAGNILIDGKPIKEFNLKHLRHHICWVGQEPILFKGSLMYNMKLARADVTAEEVQDAMIKAQGLNILNKYGLESDVGLRGSKLSGGEKQRVAIARALLRRPRILVLDESTSALDPVTEANLQEKLKEEKFTIIAIAHRLKTIRYYDNIILLELGTVVEQGNHDTLVSIPNGYYKRLYQSSE